MDSVLPSLANRTGPVAPDGHSAPAVVDRTLGGLNFHIANWQRVCLSLAVTSFP